MSDKRADKRRPAPISYRPPKGLAAEFHARVAASGLPTNAFITACVFGRSRHRAAEMETLGLLLARTAEIADHLHDLSVAGTGDNALALEAAQQDLAAVRAGLLELMGRKP